jgi:hypothetical protein
MTAPAYVPDTGDLIWTPPAAGSKPAADRRS